MANQPPPRARPLFCLASSTSPVPNPTPEVQSQPPAPQPRPPPARPAPPFRLPTAQPQPTQPQEPVPPPLASPTPKPQNSASSSSLPHSPVLSSPLTTTHVPTPTTSPKIIKPLGETPPQLKSNAELEQQKVLVQKTIERPKVTINGDSQSDVRDSYKPNITKFSGSEEVVGMRVITIGGKNRGAFMEMGHFSQKNNSGAKNDGNEWGSYSVISIDEGKLKMTDKSQQKLAMTSPTMSAFN